MLPTNECERAQPPDLQESAAFDCQIPNPHQPSAARTVGACSVEVNSQSFPIQDEPGADGMLRIDNQRARSREAEPRSESRSF